MDADHLDWHGSVEAYARILAYENTVKACVYPASDRTVEAMVENADVVEGARHRCDARCPVGVGLALLRDFNDRAFVENRARQTVALAHVF